MNGKPDAHRIPTQPSLRILLVDDSDFQLRFESLLLHDERFSLTLATDGRQALDLCRRQPPDLVIMDVEMPMMTGIEATLALRADARTENIPVILVTARSNPDIAMLPSDQRLQVVIKPLQRLVLLEHICALTGLLMDPPAAPLSPPYDTP